MELAFLTPLLKDSADSVSGGVAIYDERVLKTWLTKNGGRTDGVDKGLEGGFVLVFPMKMTTFRIVSDQSVEWCGEHTEIADIHVVEIKESKKGTQFSKCCWSFPILNPIDFDGVHGNMVLAIMTPRYLTSVTSN